ncbi:hypothetical protein [Cesiribacter sp. SM1]|uniref:hypothetical protein n=1 Tax=Cesiribacter sp. SM1 TaxID=2861196 RepID=UPI001CD410CA|nr:hypothetical protein [Cesiribacter sp. SM1]
MKFIYTFLLSISVLVVFGSLAQAQLKQPARLELELKRETDEYSVIPAGTDGIFIHQHNIKESTFSKNVYDLYLYDTTLTERWKSRLEVGNQAVYRGWEYRKGKIYLLFAEPKNRSVDYLLYTIDAETSFMRGYTIKNDLQIDLTEFTALEDLVILGGYVNYRPAVFAYDLRNEHFKVLPGLYMNNSELLELKVSPEQKTFTVLYSDQTQDKQQTIGSKTFGADGELLFEYKLKPEKDRYLLYGRTTSFGDEAVYIAGTYSNSNSKYSRGIYMARIAPDGTQKINYYNYGELTNFFSYMKEGRQKRIKKRVSRRMAQGKKVKFNYRLLVHDVVESNGNHILLAEAFYPKYQNSSSPGSYFRNSRWSGISSYPNQYLEGYKYTHAVLVGFDDDGKLLWDNSFEINEVFSPQLDKLVQVMPNEDYTVLLYTFDDAIRTKIIKNDKVLEGKSEEKLVLGHEADQLSKMEHEETTLLPWYGPYFFAYGTQRIKNSSKESSQASRKVFFINKIVYQPDPTLLENARSDARPAVDK